MTRIRMATIVLAAVAFVTAPVLAQNALRVIVMGTVADTSGGVLPDATITATAGGQNAGTATTGPDGRYRIELAGGTLYQLRVQHAGFAEHVVELQTGTANVTGDVVMGIAAISDTVVVTASSTPESLASTTASISAFTGADIDALGSSSVADIIRQVPGVNLEATEREGGLTSLFSRGGESDYNLVMIDGVRVNQSGGQFDFGRIAGAEIDRLEVVRGAQSSLYGSYAIGSVVQVFTKRGSPGDPPEFFGSIEAGSFNTVRTDVGVVGGARRMVDYQLGITYRRTDGAFSDILPEKDKFDQPTFNGGIGVTMRDLATLRAGVRVSNANGKAAGPIVYGSRDRGTLYDTRDRSGHLDFTHRLTSRMNHAATFTYFRNQGFQADTIADADYNIFAVLAGTPGAIFPNGPSLVRLVDQATFNALRSGGLGAGEFLATTSFGVSDFPFTFRTQLERPAFRYQANATWRGDQILSGGYEFEREKNRLIPAQQIDNHSYFVQQQFKVRNQWFITVGGRLDDNSRFGDSFSPKLSAGGFAVPFRPGPVSSVKVFTNVGRGIKNPTFDELFDSPFTDGNPDLHPERARTVDVGTEMTFNDQRWLTRFAYFDNRFNDQVAFRSTGFSPDGRPDFLNINGSKASGIEFEAALQRPWMGLTMSGWYALVDTKVVAFVSTSEQFQPGQPLLRRPKHVGSFRLTYVRGRGSINFDWRYAGRRHDSSFLFMSSPQFPGRSIDITLNPGYSVMGLGGEVRLHDAATVYVRINNLADEKYEMALGYPALPRAVVVGARFSVGR